MPCPGTCTYVCGHMAYSSLRYVKTPADPVGNTLQGSSTQHGHTVQTVRCIYKNTKLPCSYQSSDLAKKIRCRPRHKLKQSLCTFSSTFSMDVTDEKWAKNLLLSFRDSCPEWYHHLIARFRIVQRATKPVKRTL